MPNAIDQLMAEHRLVGRVLDALVAFADEIRRKGRDDAPERAELDRFVTFLRDYADACHYAKEDAVLFAEMVASGFPAEDGPVAAVRGQHARRRELVADLSALAGRGEAWRAAGRQRVAELAYGCADLMRDIIREEEVTIFPLAEQHLSPAAMDRVWQVALTIDERLGVGGASDPWPGLARDLVARHAPALSRLWEDDAQ